LSYKMCSTGRLSYYCSLQYREVPISHINRQRRLQDIIKTTNFSIQFNVLKTKFALWIK